MFVFGVVAAFGRMLVGGADFRELQLAFLPTSGVRACERACVRACVSVCVRVYVCVCVFIIM